MAAKKHKNAPQKNCAHSQQRAEQPTPPFNDGHWSRLVKPRAKTVKKQRKKNNNVPIISLPAFLVHNCNTRSSESDSRAVDACFPIGPPRDPTGPVFSLFLGVGMTIGVAQLWSQVKFKE